MQIYHINRFYLWQLPLKNALHKHPQLKFNQVNQSLNQLYKHVDYAKQVYLLLLKASTEFRFFPVVQYITKITKIYKLYRINFL